MTLLLLSSCGADRSAEALAGAEQLAITVCDPGAGNFSLEINNRFLPFAPGQVSVLEGKEGSNELKVRITVLPHTELVEGVETRVVEEREWVNDNLVEVSRNFVAQAADGKVCYFGEDVDDYRNGEVVGHGGAWRAGVNNALPGILMPGDPVPGTAHYQEVAPGVAEDAAIIRSRGNSYTTPAGTFQDTLEVEDVDPLSGGADRKRYAPEVGLIVDEGIVLTSFTP